MIDCKISVLFGAKQFDAPAHRFGNSAVSVRFPD